MLRTGRADRLAADATDLAGWRRGAFPGQFEVAAHRLDGEFTCPIRLEHLQYTMVRRLADPKQRSLVDSGRRSEVLTRTDGAVLALFTDKIALGVLRRQHPELVLEPLVAGTENDSA